MTYKGSLLITTTLKYLNIIYIILSTSCVDQKCTSTSEALVIYNLNKIIAKLKVSGYETIMSEQRIIICNYSLFTDDRFIT